MWSVDGNIPYLSPKHAPLFVTAVAAFLFLWLPYTLILLLGRYLSIIRCRLITRNLLRLKPFLDANYAPLHHRYQYWFGVTLLVKATVLLASATAPANSAHIVVYSLAISSAILMFWGQKVYSNGNLSLFHTSVFLNLMVLNVTKLFIFDDMAQISIPSYTLITISLVVFVGINFCRIVTLLLKKVYQKEVSEEYYALGRIAEEDYEAEEQDDKRGSNESLPTY